MLKSGLFSDVTFLVDGIEIRAHKNILETRCMIFADMFLHKMNESVENRVMIEDISFEAFHALIMYIYSGKIDIDLVTIDKLGKELLSVADKVWFVLKPDSGPIDC